MTTKSSSGNLSRLIHNVIFTVLFLIFVPILLILLAPLYIYRFLIIISCYILRPDLDQIFSAHSTFYTTSPPGEESTTETLTPIWSNILLNLKVEGSLRYEEMVQKLIRVGFEIGKNGKKIYPGFHQYCVHWKGFLFWKWEKGDEMTKAERHISRMTIPEDLTESPEEYVQNFRNEFLKTPFKEERSPWEVIFLENVTPGNQWYFVLFKFHHSLADGCSIFNVMMTCVDEPVKLTIPKVQKFSPFQNVKNLLKFLFKAVYDFVNVNYDAVRVPCSPWAIEQSKMSDSRSIVESKVISIQGLKNTGDAFGVSVSGVVLASLSGGIGKFLKKNENENFPEEMLCQMPVPIRNHPDGLTNAFSLISMRLPIGVSDLNERLKLAEESVINAKSSLFSTTVFVLGKLLGCLPYGLVKRLSSKVQPLQLSIFPGPKTRMTFHGQSVLNMSYTVYGAQFIPMIITLLSYNDGIQIILNGDNNLFPPEKNAMKNLVTEIEEEFDRSCQHLLQVKS